MSGLKKNLDLYRQLVYLPLHMLLERILSVRSFCGIISFENTLQASPMVRRCDAQTGGFIFFGECYAL